MHQYLALAIDKNATYTTANTIQRIFHLLQLCKFLQKHEDVWTKWVSGAVAKKVKAGI